MNHANHHIHFSADGHPTMELLRQYHEGLLSPEMSHQLERHLLDCELCADIVEGMELADATNTKAAVADIKERLTIAKEKRRAAAWYSDWRAVAAVFVLFCSAVVVFYYQYTNLQTTPETIAVEQSEPIESPKNQEPESKTIHEFALSPPPALDKSDKAIVKSRLKAAKITTDNTMAFTETVDEEIVVDEITVDELASFEDTPLVDLSGIDFKADSGATIAKTTAQPKARAMALSENKVQIRGLSSLPNSQIKGSQVNGKVTDDNGFPLPGVTVQVKGTTLGVSTDKDGNFSIPIPESKNVLTFRYIGFGTKEQKIDTTANLLAINLQPDNKQLSEVVVTGMGKQPTAIIEKPTPTIGTRAYKLYLENDQRPLTSKVKGRVIVGFIVTERGQLENIRILRSLNDEADAEAIRLIQQGPAWEPARQNGNTIAQQVKVVVRFR